MIPYTCRACTPPPLIGALSGAIWLNNGASKENSERLAVPTTVDTVSVKIASRSYSPWEPTPRRQETELSLFQDVEPHILLLAPPRLGSPMRAVAEMSYGAKFKPITVNVPAPVAATFPDPELVLTLEMMGESNVNTCSSVAVTLETETTNVPLGGPAAAPGPTLHRNDEDEVHSEVVHAVLPMF